jgi:hypothetical protein
MISYVETMIKGRHIFVKVITSDAYKPSPPSHEETIKLIWFARFVCDNFHETVSSFCQDMIS